MIKKIPKEIKEEVLAKARAGKRIAELAKQYGISDRTIYGWLRKDTGEDVVSILKYNKLKRENQELKRLIGELTLDMSLGKKIKLVQQGSIKSVRAEALRINRKNIYRRSKLETKDKRLKLEIELVWHKHPAYGHRRLAWELGVNHKRVLRVMNKYGIKPPRRKVKRYFCTVSTNNNNNHHYTNLIKNLKITQPHQVWVSDLSYIKFQGGFWYLATIKDIVTRQIMAVKVGRHHDAQLVLSTIKQAFRLTTPSIFHSDQGSEFMARECTNYLEAKGVKVSVSDKGSPWQNGYQESFFGRFKEEFGDFNRFNHAGELIEEIYHQVHYYNFNRRHTALKMSPVEFAASKYSDYCLQKRGT